MRTLARHVAAFLRGACDATLASARMVDLFPPSFAVAVGIRVAILRNVSEADQRQLTVTVRWDADDWRVETVAPHVGASTHEGSTTNLPRLEAVLHDEVRRWSSS